MEVLKRAPFPQVSGILLLLGLLVGGVFAQCVLTPIPAHGQYIWTGNVSIGNDTFISNNGLDLNYGTDEHLLVNCDVESGEAVTIVGMDLNGLPQGEGAWLSSATLWLYYGGYDGIDDPAGSLVWLGIPLSEYAPYWTELGATWSTVDGLLLWDYAGARPVSLVSGEDLPAEAGWVGFNVTTICTGVYGGSNYAIAVLSYYDDYCSSDYEAWFVSREDLALEERPFIEISISGLPEPTPTPTPTPELTPTPTPELTPTPTPTGGGIVINILSGFDPIPIVILAVAIALTLISTKGKSPFLWFITAFAWVALMCVWVNPWIVGISVLMAVTSLGLFVTSRGGR